MKPRTGTGDVVLREVWRAKDALAAASGYDLDKFIAGVRGRQKRSGHRVVNLQRKPAPPAGRQPEQSLPLPGVSAPRAVPTES